MKPKKQNVAMIIFFAVASFLFAMLVTLHATEYIHTNPGVTFFEWLNPVVTKITEAPLTFVVTPLFFKKVGMVIFFYAIGALWVYVENERNKQTLPGKESGSASWYTNFRKYNKKYTEPFGKASNSGDNNAILTENIYLSLNGHKTRRNSNVLVVGGSGSGKSRFYVKPNIMQANTNFVITDPAGELLKSTGSLLEKEGYEIKVFNLVEMQKSNCYNPFNYIRDDVGVLMLINCLIRNTNPAGQTSSDPFWEKSETALLQALCFYLIKYRPKEEQNFTSVMRLLRAAEVDEQNPGKKSKLDRIFDEVAVKDPTSIAYKQYQTFKMGAGRTLKSILISCSVRLTVFNLLQIENLTGVDDIDLAALGSDKKVALFVIIPAADNTYNFLVSMMYYQLFETLYYYAETEFGGMCKRNVRFLLDEFVNIGQIPDFTKKLATMRKYQINCSIILQNLAQLKALYKDDWETTVGNCDEFLFLGGQEYSTLEYISKEIGDATIVVRNTSRQRGKSGSSSLSFNRSGRRLMFENEIMQIPDDECILFIRGLKPFYDKKFTLEKHSNFKYTGDFHKDFNYINRLDNTRYPSNEKVYNDYEAKVINAYEKSKNASRRGNKAISDPRSVTAAMATIGIKSPEDIRRRLAPIPSKDEISYNFTDIDNIVIPAFDDEVVIQTPESIINTKDEIILDGEEAQNSLISNSDQNQKKRRRTKKPEEWLY